MYLFLILLAAAAVWVVRCYFWPFAPCRRCAGKGTNPGSNRKRFGECKSCGGTRRRQVLGSKTVHRVVRDTLAYHRNKKD
jgi:hypothetical protein